MKTKQKKMVKVYEFQNPTQANLRSLNPKTMFLKKKIAKRKIASLTLRTATDPELI